MIDSITADMEQQIQVLQKLKKSLIGETVTKGLDKSATMRSSGIASIGDIPQEWDVNKMSFLFSFGKGLSITKEDLRDEGIPCITYGDIHSRYGFAVNPEINPLRCVEERYMKTSKSARVATGDFIFADTSEDVEGSGNFTHLTGTSEALAGYHTIIARPSEGIDSTYMAFLFDAEPFREQIRLSVSGVKVYSVTQSIVKRCKVLVPPLDEQRAIGAFLSDRCSMIDSITADMEQQIQVLQKLKKSLIYEYVTGKKRVAM
jgi:type I restriction enzyme S subunit